VPDSYEYFVGFRKGYFKALLDVCNFWDDRSNFIKYLRLTSHSKVGFVLRKLLENRERFMQAGIDVDIVITNKELEQLKNGRGKNKIKKENAG
jgi:hypothetical protein